ncbi:MAG: DNA methyltransferase, partial [Brevibacterium aurantiacum]
GRRGVWRLSHASAVTAIADGWIRADKPHMPGQVQSHVIKFLGTATRKRIASGELHTHGLDDRGALIVDRARPVGAAVPTIWTGPRYLSEAGSTRLRELVGEGRFAYPKPVGLIADIVTAITRGRTDARVLDFFAGTGTLFDAVTELNAVDGGTREAVMIEVDPKTAAVAQERIAAVEKLVARTLQPALL